MAIRKIKFQNEEYESFKKLVDAWEKRHPTQFPVNPQSVNNAYNAWSRANAGRTPPDHVILNALKSRKAKNAITFLGKEFGGLTDLVKFWEGENPTEFPVDPGVLSQNLRKWSNRNGGRTPSDSVIKQYLKSRRAKNSITFKGVTYGGQRALYDSLNETSDIGYKNFHLKYKSWKEQNPGKLPTDQEIEKLLEVQLFKTDDGRRIGANRMLFERLPDPKISWSMFQKKIIAFKRSNQRKPTSEEMKDLALPSDEWLDDRGTNKYRFEDGHQITRQQFYDFHNFDKVVF